MVFGIVTASEWRLSENIDRARKVRLLETHFEAIVEVITKEAIPSCWKRRRLDDYPDLTRVTIDLSLSPKTVDLFHNGAGGYRAQYYLGIELGEAANRCVIDSLLPRLKCCYTAEQERPLPWENIETSLMHADARIWIREGSWLGDVAVAGQNLATDRWEGNEPKHMKRFEAWWAQQTPEKEDRLKLKGGCLDRYGAPADRRLKPCRSRDIHEHGFT
jgi:hypothetical protein